jgi:predicted PurR-regulated permease PerM
VNLQDLRVYLNMIINETVLSNMKKDLKDEKKSKDIFGYLGSLTKNINSKLIHVNKMIIQYVPKVIPKSTPPEIKSLLKELNNMKPNLTKILNNIELINKVITYFMTLVFLKKFFLKEIEENEKLNRNSLQPFKRRRFKNAKW